MVAFASERLEGAGTASLGERSVGDHVAAGWRMFVAGWTGFLRGCELLILFLEGLAAFVFGTVLMVAKFAMGVFGFGLSVWLTVTAPAYFDGWIGVVAASAPLIVAMFCLYRIYSALFVEHVPPKWIRQRVIAAVASGTRRAVVLVRPVAMWLTIQAVRQAVLLSYRGRRMLAAQGLTRGA